MIDFIHVDKSYGKKEVLKDVTFSIEKGEIFTFIGPSGTGKTTLLRMINLLEYPTSGSVIIDGKDMRIPERDRVLMRRRMSAVFQKPAAFRGSVKDNVALGLKFRGTPAGEINERVHNALSLVGLEGYADRRAGSLSGGELQRVAIARAIVTGPEILLLDEPTANLDPTSTERIENLILNLNKTQGTTIVLSTHDLIQGQRLATRIGVLMNMKIGQVGDALDVFYKPGSREIARMVGVENIFDGTVVTNENGLAVIEIGDVRVNAICTYPPGSAVTVYMRPEELTLSMGMVKKTSARNELVGTVLGVTGFGPHVRVNVHAGIPLVAFITRRSCEEMHIVPGTRVCATFKASAIHVGARELHA